LEESQQWRQSSILNRHWGTDIKKAKGIRDPRSLIRQRWELYITELVYKLTRKFSTWLLRFCRKLKKLTEILHKRCIMDRKRWHTWPIKIFNKLDTYSSLRCCVEIRHKRFINSVCYKGLKKSSLHGRRKPVMWIVWLTLYNGWNFW